MATDDVSANSVVNPERAAEHEQAGEHEHFKPIGTMFILAMFVVALILLWASVYLILLSRGVTT